LRHFTVPEFWELYEALPQSVQDLADKSFALLKANPQHPSLHFKRIGDYRSARVGLSYRALGVDVPEGVLWFWIGTHAEYDRILG
jgi:hypothetical protein